MYTGPHAKYQLFLSDFKETRFLSTDFRKLFKFHENPMRAELFHADGRTDRHEEVKLLFAIFRTRLKTPQYGAYTRSHSTFSALLNPYNALHHVPSTNRVLEALLS